jgi:hypothetical protein
MAELTQPEKDAISHRGRAARALLRYLREEGMVGEADATGAAGEAPEAGAAGEAPEAGAPR